jgi:glutamate formiminotransferase
MKILECVPNISEGRDLAVVEQIVDELRQYPDVRILNHSSDSDHNRSVLTYLGPPQAVLAATKSMTLKALELIDMRQQRGSHPRFGAVDVVPFIPIRNMVQAEAVEIARQYGRFLGEQGVPVYFYEDAATLPERRNLATVRRGQYEALSAKLQQPGWIPDEGPAHFNPKSGATATGARFPLIAFNVNLNTSDVTIAQHIAKSVRHVSGGFRYVKAMGLFLESRNIAQVSMNLTNYTKTPLPLVLETVRMEAARHGVSIAGTEIIGAIPMGAMEEIMRHYVQVHDFSLDRVIESSLL